MRVEHNLVQLSLHHRILGSWGEKKNMDTFLYPNVGHAKKFILEKFTMGTSSYLRPYCPYLSINL